MSSWRRTHWTPALRACVPAKSAKYVTSRLNEARSLMYLFVT